jgi:signal transduction histidine kinase
METVNGLAEALSTIAEGGSSVGVLARLVEILRDLSGAREASLYLLNEESGRIELCCSTSPEAEAEVVSPPGSEKQEEVMRGVLREPILDRFNRVRGVLSLVFELGADPEVDAVVPAIADAVRIVLERRDSHDREEALIQIGSALDLVQSEEELISKVIHVAEKVLRLEACSIFLLEPSTDRFVLRGTTGALKKRVGQLSYAREEGFTGWVCHVGKPIMLDDPQSDPRWRGKYVEIPSPQVASFLAVPILSRHGSIGAIRVLRRKTGNRLLDNSFTRYEQRLLQTIADQIAAALENLHNITRIIHSERMAAWGELSAKSSHMIGNRVFALKGDVNEMRHLLDQQDDSKEALRKLQKSLQTNLSRVEEILQDFRDFLGATQLSVTYQDVNQIILETIEEVFPKRTDVKLVLDLKPLPLVRVDEKKMRRAISELIENSLSHMDLGDLTIRSSVNGKLTIEIEDNGPGVAEEHKAAIFQPFFTGRARGMGLGLSIVKGIVDAHGGTVTEEGKPGSGAKFIIVIPVRES